MFWWDGSGKFKNTRRKGTDHESSKNQEGKNGGKKKKRFLLYVEVPILIMCSSSFRNALRVPPLCNPPSGEPTCMGTSPTKNNNSDRCMEQSHLSGFCFFSLCWFATWNAFESHLWHHSFPSLVLSGYTTHLQVSFVWLTKHKIVSLCCCCWNVKKQTLSSPQLSKAQ